MMARKKPLKIREGRVYYVVFFGNVEGDMDDREKLPVIIRHWIGHNEGHIEEYRQWAERADALGFAGVKARIAEAVKEIIQSNNLLQEALKELEAS